MKNKRGLITVGMTVVQDGSFTAVVNEVVYEGVLDRDHIGMTSSVKWKRKPKDKWTVEVLENTAAALVGLTPRVKT